MQVFMGKEAEGWEPAGAIFNENCRLYKPMRQGTEIKSFRVFTEIEKRAYEDAQKLITEDKFLEFQDKGTNENINEWCRLNGFNSKRVTYCIVGDTYSIKEKLKNAGCRFHPTLGWHCSETLSLPANYNIIPVTFDEAFVWDHNFSNALPRQLVPRLKDAVPPVEFAGQIGDVLTDIEATLTKITSYTTKFGLSHCYVFITENKEVLVWNTTTSLPLSEDAKCVIKRAKIKDLQVYNGEKRTIVKNLSLKT